MTFVFLNSRGALAGDYFFERPLPATLVAWRIARGTFILHPLKVTIPEGLTKFEVAALLAKKFGDFDEKAFAESAKEGYIFPDTYFLAENTKAADAVRIMGRNFNSKITLIKDKIAASDRSLDEIIKMASIIEIEARDSTTRKVISGILWKRLDIDMPLQVDVSFAYINGKGTFELTKEDLAVDSPYNSYKYPGLPPTPISNPGLDAILAALSPTATDYFYFLSDKDGKMHYAIDFEEHKENRIKYLKRVW